ncbi:tetratricopeptide repeat protein [Corallococcus carmarthensis]|uniref:TIR domain-containing protein n=1 Tax=Corallococcus carmarthensis TaxID=2316728 RepID=A0A3A8KGX1_9BACT|nr:tetratricopeptide repeat protein [Corallococcus carmarthensis]NOK15822.1 tetratricopeptide repeat protein [Corallococcus carmarthensis]RKH07448.1 TIR domain-containing protein [Corallococcus carmarthensis]
MGQRSTPSVRKSRTGTFRYDFAFSMAGSQRRRARRLALELRRLYPNVKLFLDEERPSELDWKNEHDLREIYASSARYVVTFISKDYETSDWTRLEFEAARSAERQRGNRVLLPIQCDDTTFLGLGSNVIKPDARKRTLRSIAESLLARLEEKRPIEPGAPPGPPVRELSRLFSASHRRALGLLAVFDWVPLELLHPAFPDIPWTKVLRDVRSSGLVMSEDGLLRLKPELSRSLLQDADEAKKHQSRWKEGLTKLRHHPDIALMYAKVSFDLGDLQSGCEALISAGHSVEFPALLSAYTDALVGILTHERFHVIGSHQRRRALNSLGICLCRQGMLQEALKYFQHLQSWSRASGDAWAQGQALINAGVAEARLGHLLHARAFYEMAAEFGRKTSDRTLRARALGNLAMTGMGRPERAERMLRESIALKEVIHDEAGLFAGDFTQGLLAAGAGQWREAIPHFAKAAQRARSTGRVPEEAAALVQLGESRFKAGRVSAALSTYRKARQRASSLPEQHAERNDALIGAVQGEAVVLRESRQWKAAEPLFLELMQLKEHGGDRRGALDVAHDLALLHEEHGKKAEALNLFEKTAARALRLKLFEPACRCLLEAARLTDGKHARARTLLRRARAVVETHGTSEQRIHVARLQAAYENAQGCPDKSEALLRDVQPLATETGLKLELLHSRMEILLQANRWPEARRLYSRLTHLAAESGQHAASINARLAMGGRLWAAGGESRFEACQAYVMALLLAISESEHLEADAFITVGIQMVATLMSNPSGKIPFEKLSDRLARWLIREWDLAKHPEFQHLGLWPLAVVRTLQPIRQRRKPSLRIIERVVEHEFRSALDGVQKVLVRGPQ